MSATWKTKFGLRRVRHDPPTINEAIFAAQGLTDDREQQVQIAADLMGVALADARAEFKSVSADSKTSMTIIPSLRDKGPRVVVVERRASRRLIAKPASRPAPAFAVRGR